MDELETAVTGRAAYLPEYRRLVSAERATRSVAWMCHVFAWLATIVGLLLIAAGVVTALEEPTASTLRELAVRDQRVYLPIESGIVAILCSVGLYALYGICAAISGIAGAVRDIARNSFRA